MFFKRKESQHAPVAVAESAEAIADRGAPASSGLPSQSEMAQATALLDAIGGLLNALARYPIDLPHRPAGETTRELTAWQRHATMGFPVDTELAGETLSIEQRDWRGLTRAIADMRRVEQESVEAMVSELRTALWTCVSTVHEAVKIDDASGSTTSSKLALVKRVVSNMQHTNIRDDVLNAVTEIDRTLRERREAQQRQFTQLASTLDNLGRQLEEAKKESATDPLTGVGNRKRFDLMSERAVQLHSLSRSPVTLLMIDLNRLKIINDSYGHTAGDAAIQSVAHALVKVFARQSDVVCRYGGDEFAVILHGCDVGVAQTLSKRLVDTVRGLPKPHEAMEFALGASVGVAQLLAGEDVPQWVERADRAMYLAKKRATSGVMVADTPPVTA